MKRIKRDGYLFFLGPPFTISLPEPPRFISLSVIFTKKSLARWPEILYILIHDGSSLSGKGPANPAFDSRYPRNDSGDG